MYNLRRALEEYELQHDEQIQFIVVGQHDDKRWVWKPLADENIVLSREEGLAKLDVDYDNGYGSANCFPFYAWSYSRVYFVAEYDGATHVSWLPTIAMNCEPGFQ